MKEYYIEKLPKTKRISNLVTNMYLNMPRIESARAILITESYKETENEPIVIRRAKAFSHILQHIPIIIREEELIVGSSTLASRGCQTFPEFSFEWLEEEFDTLETRSADPFSISEETKKELIEVHTYWKGKTTSDLATAYMSVEALRAISDNIFTVGNYFYNGIGHVTVDYGKVIQFGYLGIIERVEALLNQCNVEDHDYAKRTRFLQSVMISCEAAIGYANRYADEAEKLAANCSDSSRQRELLQIANNCRRVPANGAETFYEACQSFWFIQQLIQIESSGHSISPGRFDQYMKPYYEKDIEKNLITRAFAQELVDCVWVKFNDLDKCRDLASAEGFAGYSLFQNLIVGGQDKEGKDATNDLSYMCISASEHVFLPMPSLSIRVWNGSPQTLLIKAAELTRTGIGLPAYYSDEVIIPAMMSRGVAMEDARDYSIIGCVEPHVPGKTDGWHDAAFFNMCRPLELVFSNGYTKESKTSIQTGEIEEMKTFDEFYDAYKKQMEYQITLMANAANAVDVAHSERCPLPFLSSMIADCLGAGKSAQDGGATYNFTGPQGFGIANMADSLFAIRKYVFEEKVFTLGELKKVLALNYGKGFDAQHASELALEVIRELQKQGKDLHDQDIVQIINSIINTTLSVEDQELCDKIFELLDQAPKFGNDLDEVDIMARDVAYTFTKPVEKFKNPRGGIYQAGLYPVSANVPLGAQTGATPDARLAHMPVADGVSPSSGRDIYGPTAAANSVAKLDHMIASNGTLFNQKFHPSALSGNTGLENFVSFIRAFFDQKGMHMQFNVVDRDTLLQAQKNPKDFKHLVVRVAGYSALFTTLSRSLQDDIIRRTEQGF